MSKRLPGILISVLSLLLMLAPAVSAQTSTLVPRAITVLGEGSASAPAETATVVISIGADGNVYYDPMTIEPEGTAAPEEVDVSAVIDAIIAHGVPVNDVELVETPFMGEWGSGMGPQPVTIFVTVIQPTVDDLSELLNVVRTTAHTEGLFVNQFGVMYRVSDCRSLRQEARADAVTNAREEAEDQAAALETTIGDVVASGDTMPMSMGPFQANSCNSVASAQPYNAIYMAGQFDPSQPAEVQVSVAVEVSFQIP